MGWLVLFAGVLLAGCASAPAPLPVESARPDPTADPAYRQSVEELQLLARETDRLLRSGKTDEAGALITKAQPLVTRVLAAQRPSLAAMEAASDLDQLYGGMLLANHHYGWARLLLQKNLARWTNWVPQTAETVRRKKLAEAAIAECDRRMAE